MPKLLPEDVNEKVKQIKRTWLFGPTLRKHIERRLISEISTWLVRTHMVRPSKIHFYDFGQIYKHSLALLAAKGYKVISESLVALLTIIIDKQSQEKNSKVSEYLCSLQFCTHMV